MAPTQSTGAALAGYEGDVMRLRGADRRRNSPLIAAGQAAWKYELRERAEPQPDSAEAAAAWQAWARWCGYRHQPGCFAQIIGLWIDKALEHGGAFLQRVKIAPSAYNPNGLLLLVRSTREVERGQGDGGLQYEQGAILAGVWFQTLSTVRGFSAMGIYPAYADMRDLAYIRKPADTDTDDGEPLAHAAIVSDTILQDLTLADMRHHQTAANITAIGYSSRASMSGRNLPLAMGVSTSMTGANGEPLDRLAPGTAMVMSGVDGVAFPPSAVDGTAYDSHVARVCASLGHTRQTIGGDTGTASMSSLRHATQLMRQRGQDMALDLGLPEAMNTVLGWFLEAELMAGRDWTGENWDWIPRAAIEIDPVKKVTALEIELKNGLESLPGAIRRMGRDPRIVARERAQMPAIETETPARLRLVTDKDMVDVA
jgi:hypothetical protein